MSTAKDYDNLDADMERPAGENMQELRAIVDRCDVLEAKLKVEKERRRQLEQWVIRFCTEQGIDSVKDTDAGLTVSVGQRTVCQFDADDWTNIVDWANNTANQQILTRQLAGAKVNSLMLEGVELPQSVSVSYIPQCRTTRHPGTISH